MVENKNILQSEYKLKMTSKLQHRSLQSYHCAKSTMANINDKRTLCTTCADTEISSEGSNSENAFLTTPFLVDEWREGPTNNKRGPLLGPPTKRHLNGVALAGQCGPTLNAALVAL